MLIHSVHFVALIVAAIAAFVLSSVWYTVFAKVRQEATGMDRADVRRPTLRKILAELARSVIVAYVFALLLGLLNDSGIGPALGLALVLGVAFPGVLLSGSVMWDKVPAKLAAIHAGDWLLKLLLFAVILGVWH